MIKNEKKQDVRIESKVDNDAKELCPLFCHTLKLCCDHLYNEDSILNIHKIVKDHYGGAYEREENC